nr:MAG TPA: hypothetical protein [Caudoviricetes sp.]
MVSAISILLSLSLVCLFFILLQFLQACSTLLSN